MERQAKVRKFKPNTKSQLQTRASSSNVPAISENRGSTKHNYMSKAKRVKFTHSESARPPIPDVPKTSEYAFFKKLKEDIGGGCHPLHEDWNQIKTANANDSNTEASIPSKVLKFTDRKMRSPLQTEKERPTYQFSFPSPPIRAESDYAGGLNSKDEFRKSRAPLPSAYFTPDGKNLVLSPFPSVSKISGDEYVGKGIFTVRRHKLRQLVANSYPEIGGSCSKGFDLVCALLSRLFPERYKNERCQYASSEEREMDTTYQLAAPRELYSEEKISNIRNSSKINFGSCCNDDFPEYWFGSPRKRVISKWDVTNPKTQMTEYTAAIDFEIEEMNSFCSLDGEAIEKNFGSFDNYQSSCSAHLKWMDRFHDPNEFAHTLLLGLDADEEKEQHISFSMATSSNVAYQKTLDDSLHALTMPPSSSCSKYSLDLQSLPYFLSARGRSHDLGINDEDNYAALEAKHYLSSTPSCLTMTEDCDTCHEKNKVILYCQDDPCCIASGSGRKDHVESLPLPGRFTDDFGWKLLPLSEFFREDYSSSSHIFQLPSNSKEDVNSFALVQSEESSLYCPKNRETTLTFPEDGLKFPHWFSSNLHASLDKWLGQSFLLEYSGRSEDVTYFDAENQWNSS